MVQKIKRLLCLIMVFVLAFLICGCKKEAPADEIAQPISIYSTFYPLHALTEKITSGVDGVKTFCLVQPQDGCIRDYMLSDWDLALLLRSADAVISGGRGLESFESTLFALGENGPAVSAIMYNMALDTVAAAGVPEGEASHWDDANPHIYMSVDGAIALAEQISAAMQSMDPEYAEKYHENYLEAENELKALKDQMNSITEGISGTKIAVLNEAIWYFAKNFDVDTALCYHRESGEDINNTDTLIDSIKNSGAAVVLIEKQAPYRLVEALKDAGIAVAKIDILSTHRAEDGFDGYIEAQISNANALKNACDQANG